MISYNDSGDDLWIARLQTNYNAFAAVRTCPSTPAPANASLWKAPQDEAAPRNVPAGTPLPGGINLGFVDGHAGFVKLQLLWTLTWHNGWVMPTLRPP